MSATMATEGGRVGVPGVEAGAMRDRVGRSVGRLLEWVERHGYRAYDPGDGNSSVLHGLTFNVLMLERWLQQAVYRAPINLRPLFGIRPHTSTKGMGYMAWGHLRMYRATGDPRYREGAERCLAWLEEHRSPGFEHPCWGNHFPFSTRAGKIPAGAPTIVWSSLIGLAFLEGYETLGVERYLGVARGVCEWILDLPREQTSSGCCLSYVTGRQSSIHNSNLLGAGLLARVGLVADDARYLSVARDAVVYSCSRMRPDGSWYYGEEPKYHWIDHFHTGYNLDSLRRYMESAGDGAFEGHLRRGFAYYLRTFFEEDGCPRYYHDRKYPVDIQCAAQAIDTLTWFSDREEGAWDRALQTAGWTLDHMQGRDGHFYYRDLGWIVVRTPMFHWGQGTMYKALASLYLKLSAGRAVTSGGRR